MKDEILLGDVVQDTITGFKGVVIGRTEWIHGCIRLSVQPQELKDGKPIDALSFDEPQLKRITKGPRHKTPIASHPGGPHPEPSRR